MLPDMQSRIQLIDELQEYLSNITTQLTSQDTSLRQSPDSQSTYPFDASLGSLDLTYKRFLAALSRERNAFSKASSFPNEVICEIISYGGIYGVIKGSQVCHRWRHAALISPTLWCYIHIGTKGVNVKLISMQLERSGGYPLHVNFGKIPGYSSLLPPEMALSTLLIRAGTIEHLTTLTLESSRINEAFSMPQLESMHITVNSRESLHRLTCIRNCPRLQHMSIKTNRLSISQ
ncbi:hypothetical protein CPB86DRAFT_735982, partial [Serendipita vermifera]